MGRGDYSLCIFFRREVSLESNFCLEALNLDICSLDGSKICRKSLTVVDERNRK